MLLCIALAATLYGCENSGTTQADVAKLTVWAHAGQESERATLQAQASRFNNTHPDLEIQLTLIPEGSYNAQVQAAAVAGELPDILELDGPFLYAYAWQGHLRPLDDLLSDALRADLLPSIIQQGLYQDRLWSVAVFDSGLGLYADRAKLLQAGIRIPTLENPWKEDEFEEILQRLARQDPDGQVLDLKLNYAGEWYTYGLSPLIQSAGGDLIDRRGYASADGVLNGPQTVAMMTTLQNWIQDNRIDPNIDDAAFVTHRVALAVGGHWNYRRYHASLGNDLLLLPLPDFGRGSKTGQGSWCWAVTAGSRQTKAASRFLTFLLDSDEVLSMTNANGAVPATRSAISRSPLYRPGGPLHLFVKQLEGGHAVPRPRTPAYPLITAEFQQVLDRIRSGGDVRATLDKAVQAIDREIEDNRSYPTILPSHEP
ncbi:MAG: extracellular solute-binding protein [Candidatus Thiodiazotropha sp. (ex Epidulcina cf. delphinae)]|nr:extracellular solute-binding protein [Candidatus Thiodiazotropha sp. (ex Epidulcina cf. delphinae)]